MNVHEEQELIDLIEAGEWNPIDQFENLKKKLMLAAEQTSLKDYRINVRISKRDIEALKTRALEEGIPYRTLITSVLHKYVTGSLVDSDKRNYA